MEKTVLHASVRVENLLPDSVTGSSRYSAGSSAMPRFAP